MARHDHPAGCTADAHIHTIEHAALPGVMLCADGDHDPRCCRFPKSCSEGREPVVEGGPTWREWQP